MFVARSSTLRGRGRKTYYIQANAPVSACPFWDESWNSSLKLRNANFLWLYGEFMKINGFRENSWKWLKFSETSSPEHVKIVQWYMLFRGPGAGVQASSWIPCILMKKHHKVGNSCKFIITPLFFCRIQTMGVGQLSSLLIPNVNCVPINRERCFVHRLRKCRVRKHC